MILAREPKELIYGNVQEKLSYGYKLLTVYNHPNCRTTIYYHRLTWELYHNKFLTSEEIVHHKDQNKLNNNIDNLQKLTRSEHKKLHNKIHNPLIKHQKRDYCTCENLKDESKVSCIKCFNKWYRKNREQLSDKRQCINCKEIKIIHGRGLCENCYKRERYRKSITQSEAPNVPISNG